MDAVLSCGERMFLRGGEPGLLPVGGVEQSVEPPLAFAPAQRTSSARAADRQLVILVFVFEAAERSVQLRYALQQSRVRVGGLHLTGRHVVEWRADPADATSTPVAGCCERISRGRGLPWKHGCGTDWSAW